MLIALGAFFLKSLTTVLNRSLQEFALVKQFPGEK